VDYSKKWSDLTSLPDPIVGDRPNPRKSLKLVTTGFPEMFVASLYSPSLETPSRKSADVMESLCKVHHPSLVPISFFCDMVSGKGPIFGTPFYANGSVRSLAELRFGFSELNSTRKAILICELVCGLIFLHRRGIWHGSLSLGKLLVDEELHLHINGWADSQLYEAKLIPSLSHADGFIPGGVVRAHPSYPSFEDLCEVDIHSLGVIICAIIGNINMESKLAIDPTFRPGIPGRISPDMKKLIEGCLSSDSHRSIEEVLARMVNFQFQFDSDVDRDIVLDRMNQLVPLDLVASFDRALEVVSLGVQVCDFSSVSILDEISKGSFGRVCLVNLLDEGRIDRLAVQFYQVNPDLAVSGDPYKEIIAAYSKVVSPFLSRQKYYQHPIPNSGPLIAMDSFGAGPLSGFFPKLATLPPREVIDRRMVLIGGLIFGLKALHDANLFHANLHPKNIILTQDSSVCITDSFGWIFQRLELTTTKVMVVPRYMAPELVELREAEFDLRNSSLVEQLQKVDIYSLGLISYEILTGNPVFSPSEELLQNMERSRSSVRPIIPDLVDDRFADLIRRAWNQKPDDRPTIDEFSQCFIGLNYAVMSGVDPSFVAQALGRIPEEHPVTTGTYAADEPPVFGADSRDQCDPIEPKSSPAPGPGSRGADPHPRWSGPAP
jgi:serine/threonine protein kinase